MRGPSSGHDACAVVCFQQRHVQARNMLFQARQLHRRSSLLTPVLQVVPVPLRAWRQCMLLHHRCLRHGELTRHTDDCEQTPTC